MRLTRIGLVEGQACQTRLDLVILREAPLAVESTSWSRIKALYRGY